MVDDVKNIIETAESKAQADAIDRARLARERREAEQRKRLDELRAHAAAAQAQREKRDEDRRRRQAEQRAKDDDRRQQVEERKRAIWEASVSRREALLQRERDRTERLERARAARSAPRPAFAFGSSTPRLLEPLDSAGFFWAARRAASTTNVMFASAPLTRRASALHLDSSDNDTKDESERPAAPAWSSVARRRTDLVPTAPAPRAPECRSGESTPSRPGSALSQGVPRRATPRRPRPASIAGTGVNTPRAEAGGVSQATTPNISRDSSVVGGDVPRRPQTARRPRPASAHIQRTVLPLAPGEGKPPLHRKPKSSKEQEKGSCGKSLSSSPGREPSPPSDISASNSTAASEKSQVSAIEVTQKLEALQIQNGESHTLLDSKVTETKETVVNNEQTHTEHNIVEVKHVEVQKPVEKKEEIRQEKKEEVRQERKEEIKQEVKKEEEKKDSGQEKTDESEMTASMTARRITTEEEAKAALAERRRKAREELERQAELERQRLQREAEEEAERQRQEEERQRKEEEEARELAEMQRKHQEEKLRRAIEAQQQLEREENERRAREEEERRVRLREEEEKRRAAEEAERARREEAEREERERLARKQRVEAIMARTRLKKQAEEDKKAQEKAVEAPQQKHSDNGNGDAITTGDLLGIGNTQPEESIAPIVQNNASEPAVPSQCSENGNRLLLDVAAHDHSEATVQESAKENSLEAAPAAAEGGPANGNAPYAAHNGHRPLPHPLTLQNAL